MKNASLAEAFSFLRTSAGEAGRMREMLGKQLRVRRLEMPDLYALLKILDDYRREYALETSDRGIFEVYRHRRSAYFVALVNDEVVGGAGISRLEGAGSAVCELERMVLRRSFRGLGIGRVLLEECLETARGLAYEQCYAAASAQMTTAIMLCERRGFERLDRPLGPTNLSQEACWMLLEFPPRQEAL